MTGQFGNWICCQIGAREHYSIPRTLHRSDLLGYLFTDSWVSPASFWGRLPLPNKDRLRQRYHTDMESASICSFTGKSIVFEVTQQLIHSQGWNQVMQRNAWFQKQTVEALSCLTKPLGKNVIVFAYSYAALEIFRFAKAQQWKTVLGQIDPGWIEERLVEVEVKKHPEYASRWQPAPEDYWANWKEECNLSDHILVNSQWSKDALAQVGVPQSKVNVVPLAYNAPTGAINYVRRYPSEFTSDRPLRVLFLGQLILRKGIAALLEASIALCDYPIEFWLVGPCEIDIPDRLRHAVNVKWLGSVSRADTSDYYRNADIFLFPTLSDGFGLTQLEAQAWKLPIIASKFCGSVVQHSVNGILLQEVSSTAIQDALVYCLNDPERLAEFSKNSALGEQFSVATLHERLLEIAG